MLAMPGPNLSFHSTSLCLFPVAPLQESNTSTIFCAPLIRSLCVITPYLYAHNNGAELVRPGIDSNFTLLKLEEIWEIIQFPFFGKFTKKAIRLPKSYLAVRRVWLSKSETDLQFKLDNVSKVVLLPTIHCVTGTSETAKTIIRWLREWDLTSRVPLHRIPHICAQQKDRLQWCLACSTRISSTRQELLST